MLRKLSIFADLVAAPAIMLVNVVQIFQDGTAGDIPLLVIMMLQHPIFPLQGIVALTVAMV